MTNERATGEAYCLAHHITTDGDKRRFMVASLRYHETHIEALNEVRNVATGSDQQLTLWKFDTTKWLDL